MNFRRGAQPGILFLHQGPSMKTTHSCVDSRHTRLAEGRSRTVYRARASWWITAERSWASSTWRWCWNLGNSCQGTVPQLNSTSNRFQQCPISRFSKFRCFDILVQSVGKANGSSKSKRNSHMHAKPIIARDQQHGIQAGIVVTISSN